jgi:hypothetical protein
MYTKTSVSTTLTVIVIIAAVGLVVASSSVTSAYAAHLQQKNRGQCLKFSRGPNGEAGDVGECHTCFAPPHNGNVAPKHKSDSAPGG